MTISSRSSQRTVPSLLDLLPDVRQANLMDARRRSTPFSSELPLDSLPNTPPPGADLRKRATVSLPFRRDCATTTLLRFRRTDLSPSRHEQMELSPGFGSRLVVRSKAGGVQAFF